MKTLLKLSSLPLLVIFLSACQTVTPTKCDNCINVGVAGPMSGQYNRFGDQMKIGAEQAIIDINNDGGVLGKKLALQIGDDQCSADKSINVAKEMAALDVKFVAGHFCSDTSINTSNIYLENKIIQMSPASSKLAFTERGLENVFRIVGKYNEQAAVFSDFIQKNLPQTSIGIIHDESNYGSVIGAEAYKLLKENNHKVAFFSKINKGQRNFPEIIRNIEVNDIKLVYFAGYIPEAAALIKQIRQTNKDLIFFTTDSISNDTYYNIAGSATDGTIITYIPIDEKNPPARSMVDRIKSRGYSASGYTASTYAAFQVWSEAVNKSKSLEMTDVAKTIKNNHFNTTIGTTSFNKIGDRTLPGFVLYEWQGGHYLPLNTPDKMYLLKK